MNLDKMKRLEAHGWKVGGAEEFLGLTVDNNYILSQVKVSRIAAPTFIYTIEYKGYYAVIEVDVEENILFGRVIDIEDVITFKARTVEQAKIEFVNSVEDYLEFCKELN